MHQFGFPTTYLCEFREVMIKAIIFASNGVITFPRSDEVFRRAKILVSLLRDCHVAVMWLWEFRLLANHI